MRGTRGWRPRDDAYAAARRVLLADLPANLPMPFLQSRLGWLGIEKEMSQSLNPIDALVWQECGVRVQRDRMARYLPLGISAAPHTTMRALPIWLAGILYTLATVAGASPGGSPKSWDIALPSLVKRCGPSVVVVTAQTDSGTSQGSGVILDDDPGRVLTCDHVIRGARSVSVKTSAGVVCTQVGLLWSSTTYDLALLEVSVFEPVMSDVLTNTHLRSAPIGDLLRPR